MSTAYDGSTSVLAITFPTTNIFPTKVGGMNWVHIFSPTIVNSARVGFTRTIWSEGLPQDFTGRFGTKGNAVVGISFPNQAYQGFSYQGISNQGGLDNPTGVGTPAYFGGLTDNTYSYIDNITIQKGCTRSVPVFRRCATRTTTRPAITTAFLARCLTTASSRRIRCSVPWVMARRTSCWIV